MTRRADGIRGATPWVLTLLLLASRLSFVPPLSDPLGGQLPDSLQLSVPPLYLVLAPLFTLWDGISMLSMSRLHGFLVGLAGFYVLGRIVRHIRARPPLQSWSTWVKEIGILLLSLGGLLAFIIAGALWHRPMLSLTGVPWGYQVADFHSHTTASHDVGDTWMSGYDLAANLRWHGRAGFNVVFVTDHNVVSRESGDARRQSGVGSRESGDAGPIPCPGMEVSAWKAHIVLLGDTLPIDRAPYSGSLAGLLTLLRISDSSYGSLSLASLPEYRRNHWERLDTLIAAGLDGFEIVNASPKANELTRPERDRVIDLARKNDLFIVGVSDSHGWGATSMVWNLVRVPHAHSRQTLCTAILGRLDQGFPGAQIVERHRLRPDDPWPMWLTPLGVVWETWRSMGRPLALSWLAWIWVVTGLLNLLRSRALRANIARRATPIPPVTDR
ncbi:MAG: PHP domain-containing protein [Gemmatimonadales bacterium]